MFHTDNFRFTPISSYACKKSRNFIIEDFHYHPERERADREKAILNQIFSDGAKNKTKIFKITDTKKRVKGTLGIVALSPYKLELGDEEYSSIRVDFLFVDYRHRKTIYSHFGEKVSTLLLYFVFQYSLETGVEYLILWPDGGKQNPKLVGFYEKMSFQFMTPEHEWMFSKLS